MNPWTDLPRILIGELGRNTGMFLALFLRRVEWEIKLGSLDFQAMLSSQANVC